MEKYRLCKHLANESRCLNVKQFITQGKTLLEIKTHFTMKTDLIQNKRLKNLYVSRNTVYV